MFETLSSPSGSGTFRRRALGTAVGLHTAALVLVLATSLWALEPITAPLPYVVFTVVLGPPPAQGIPAPRTPAPRTTRTTTPVTPKPRPELAQPTVMPDPIVATTPETASDEASSDELGPLADLGTGSGTPDGVPAGIGRDERASPFATNEGQDEIRHVGGDVHAPRVIEQVKPNYPPAAVAARIEGVVVLQAVINESGRVEGATVLRGHALLDSAALDAVQQWRFEPGLLNRKPVKVYFTLTVNFRLKR